MIEACKICNNNIPVPELGDDWWCPKCQQYSIVCDYGQVESETIRSGNFYMVYMPAYKTASISSTDSDDKKIFKSFEMNELTHEQAVQWVKKLKLYVTFQ
jgi:hypothetical protein